MDIKKCTKSKEESLKSNDQKAFNFWDQRLKTFQDKKGALTKPKTRLLMPNPED